MLLGVLTKEMHANHFFSPQAKNPFVGLSYAEVKNKLLAFRSPSWSSRDDHYGRRSYYQEHSCKIQPDLEAIIKSLEDLVRGLTLDDFPCSHEAASSD